MHACMPDRRKQSDSTQPHAPIRSTQTNLMLREEREREREREERDNRDGMRAHRICGVAAPNGLGSGAPMVCARTLLDLVLVRLDL